MTNTRRKSRSAECGLKCLALQCLSSIDKVIIVGYCDDKFKPFGLEDVWKVQSDTRSAPLAPQFWGELESKSPRLGGFRGQIDAKLVLFLHRLRISKHPLRSDLPTLKMASTSQVLSIYKYKLKLTRSSHLAKFC